jgi:hypothetical protein
MPETFLEWVAYLGLALPLVVIAWSGATYAIALRGQNEHARYTRFFYVMDQLGKHGGSVASKMAAAYELRKYLEYKELIIRMCDQVQVDGESAEMLRQELKLTANFLRDIS